MTGGMNEYVAHRPPSTFTRASSSATSHHWLARAPEGQGRKGRIPLERRALTVTFRAKDSATAFAFWGSVWEFSEKAGDGTGERSRQVSSSDYNSIGVACPPGFGIRLDVFVFFGTSRDYHLSPCAVIG